MLLSASRLLLEENLKYPGGFLHRGISMKGELLLGRPEDLGDGVDLTQQAVGDRDVVSLLRFAGGLGGLPKEFVEIRVLLKVLGLEVVGPQNPQVMLDEFAALFFDEQRAHLEVVVARRVELLHAALDRLRFDPRLRWVVHATRQVAVRRGDQWGGRCI
jgi:hypothetical protein